MITPSGFCCESGDVDAAGVCDGKGELVSKAVKLSGVIVAASSSTRRLLAATLEQRITTIVTEQLGYPTDAFPLGFKVDVSEGADGKPVVRHPSCTVNRYARDMHAGNCTVSMKNCKASWVTNGHGT